MEQTISPTQTGMNPKTVKTLKIVAFTCCILGLINALFTPRIISWLFGDNHFDWLNYVTMSSDFALAIFWICLAITAPNKATRIALLASAFAPLLIYNIKLPFLTYPNICFYWALARMLPIYLMSILLMNLSFTSKERVWCSILLLIFIAQPIIQIMRFCYEPSLWDMDFNDNGRLMNEWYESQYYNDQSIYTIYEYIIPVFSVIAYYKVCFSKALSGNYDASVKGRYTPLNKYFIGALLTIIVTCGLLCLIFFFRHDIMNLL